MYLGHNFDKMQGLISSVKRGYEENLTWRRIRDSVIPFISQESIWFTNYFMGVLTSNSNIGEIKRTSSFATFEEDCWQFLKKQIALQRPRLIVALGKEVAHVLHPEDRFNLPQWKFARSEPYAGLRLKKHKVLIELGAEAQSINVVAAYHPSYGRSNAQIQSLIEDSKFVSSILDSR